MVISRRRVVWVYASVLVLLGAAAVEAALTRGPYLQNVTTNSIVICWETDTAATGKIVFGKDGGEQRTVAADEARTRQEVALDGLEPNTVYAYEVTVGDQTVGGHFRTAPQPGTPFTFVVTGDSRTNADIAERVAAGILQTGAPLVVHTGDLVAQGRDLSLWDPQFFKPLRAVLANAVLYPAVGNHELGGPRSGPDGREVFASMFALPGNELYYSFDYGDVHFVVLDSTMKVARTSDQYRWAEKDLTDSKAAWKVVAFHHPMYCAGSHGSDLEMRNVYGPLFARTGVDLIVTGHEHNYQRARFIAHRLEPAAEHPYLHVISGGGGANLYGPREDELWVGTRARKHHFAVIRVDGAVMSAKVIDIDGHQIDSWTIDKANPATDVVAYEQIELVRVLSEPRFADAAGRSPELVFDQTGRQAGFAATWSNPMPVPVKLAVQASSSDGTKVSPTHGTLDLAASGEAGATQQIEFVVSLEAGRADHGPVTVGGALTSPFGSNQLKPCVLPVGLKRSLAAAKTQEPVRVDGVLDDAGWQGVGPSAVFVAMQTGRALAGAESPQLRVAADAEKLYVGLAVPLKQDYRPRTSGSIVRGDHILLLTASADASVKIVADPRGRTRDLVQGAAQESVGVDCASRVDDGRWTFEAEVPLALLGVGGARSLGFNVGVLLNREWSTWSPTGGQPISEKTNGSLSLP